MLCRLRRCATVARCVEDQFMLISEIEGVEFAPEHPELAGKRVLITGIKGGLGFEIVKAFAATHARLVLHTLAEDDETVAIGEAAAAEAMDVRLFPEVFADYEAMLAFTRKAVTSYGGIDAVVNVTRLCETDCDGSRQSVERSVTDLLAMPCLVSRIAANRMKTTLSEGAILNILETDRAASPQTATLAGVARNVLAGMTRSEAQQGAEHGVRINAIAPIAPTLAHTAPISSAPDVATLARHLVSPRGHQLSGLVFEAYFG